MSTFEGFPQDTIRFLRDLGKNNNRNWFAQNKARYEASFLEPSLAFICAMEKPLGKSAPLLKAEAKKVGGSLMRIYKDTRFSKDKTPYKTNIGIQFRHQLGKDVHAPGIYLHVAADECFLGAGIWRPPGPELKQIREMVAESNAQWRKVIKNKRFSREFTLHDDRLKSAPRGFDRQHPAIDDLRLKSFIGLAPISKQLLQSKDLLPHVVELTKASKPLMVFLCEALQQPY